MERAVAAIIIVGALLAGCATPTPVPTATSVQVAVETTATASPTDTPVPSPTPRMSPTQEGCVRASAEIPEGQNPTRYVTSGPASGCYGSIGDLLEDIGLSWEEFEPGTAVTFWTQWPVDERGALVYPTPTPTPIPPTPSPVPPPHLAPGVLVSHEADDTIAYNWLTYVPSNISKSEVSYILVSPVVVMPTDDYGFVTDSAQGFAYSQTPGADQHRYFLLVPAIPRPRTNHVYAVAFDWKVFLDSTDPFVQTPGLKVNHMIDRFGSDLRNIGYNVQEKVFVEGLSAGGMFAQRYALLNPERIQAVAAGHCGGAMTLPESSYNGIEMNWPVGVNDFLPLVGYEFNQAAYSQVPQLIYIGDQDTTNSMLPRAVGFFRTQANVDFLNGTFGVTDPVRLENEVRYLNSLGYSNIVFKKYPGVGHQITSEMRVDSMAFLNAHR